MAKFKLKYNPQDYTPMGIRTLFTEKQARKEYSSLRPIIIKRLKRLPDNDPIRLKYPVERFKRLKDISSTRTLEHLLSELVMLYVSKRTTATGRKELFNKAKERFNDLYGLDIRTEEELRDFGEFMETVRNFATDRIYDSDRAAKIYAEHKGYDKKNLLKLYEKFLKSKEKPRSRSRRTGRS